MIEEHGSDGDKKFEEETEFVYQEIRRRLLRFEETGTERELRVQGGWDGLMKTNNMTALQFEALWESRHRELERVGLGLQGKQKYTQYLIKVRREYAEAVRMDR